MKKERKKRSPIITLIILLSCMALLYGLDVRRNKLLDEKTDGNNVTQIEDDGVSLGDVNNDYCTSTEAYCPKGWTKSGNTCSKSKGSASSFDYECPSGTAEVNGQCIEYTGVSYRCIKCSGNAYLYNNSCYVCAAGKGLDTGNRTCSSCASGYYSPSNNAYCTACSKGYAPNSSQSGCVRVTCPAGQGLDSSATTGCSDCAAGTYSRDDDGTCHKCSDYYTSAAGASSCYRESCPAGQGLDPSATTGCSDCAAGTYSPDHDGTCHKCDDGYTSGKGASECTKVKCKLVSNDLDYTYVESGSTVEGALIVEPANCDYGSVTISCGSNCSVASQPSLLHTSTDELSLSYSIKFSTNKSQCPGPKAKFTITVGDDSQTVTTTIAKPFESKSIGSRFFSSAPPYDADEANYTGSNYYGEDCEEVEDGWFCENVYTRGCGSVGEKFSYCCSDGQGGYTWKKDQTSKTCPTGTTIDESKDSTTCKNSYNFCCTDGKGGNVWKTNQTSRKCSSGYTIDESKNKTTCVSSYNFCCKDGKGDFSWKTNQTSKTCPTGYTIDTTKNSTTCIPSYNFCCTDGKGTYTWNTGKTSKTCPSGETLDSTKNATTCKTSPACYINSEGIYSWTADFNYGTKTSKTQEQCKNCYANAPSLNDATSTGFTKDLVNTYFIKNVSAEGCVPPKKVSFCEPTRINPSAQTKEASECEDNINISYNDGYTCEGNSFYNISCVNTVKVSFDNNDDGTSTGSVNSLLAGEGFAFGLTLKITKTCNATFNGPEWNKAYNTVLNEYNKANNHLKAYGSKMSADEKKIYESRKAEAQNNLEKIKGYINTYSSMSFNTEFDKNAKFSMDYKSNGKNKTLATDFVIESESGGTGKKTNGTTVNLGVSGITYPHNYVWTNEASPRIVKLSFPNVYFDSKTGEIGESGDIPGGRKLYTDYNTDSKTYPMTINISTNSETIKIKNEKCSIKVNDKPKLIYRPIDLTNPFINTTRKKGENWLNSTYDFTQVIHDTTWSEAKLYNISLTSKELAELRKSTSNNLSSSPYLGLCGKQSPTLYDDITKKLCDIIK